MGLAMSAQPGGLALLCFLLGLQGSLAAGMLGAGEGGWKFFYGPCEGSPAVGSQASQTLPSLLFTGTFLLTGAFAGSSVICPPSKQQTA